MVHSEHDANFHALNSQVGVDVFIILTFFA